jgi:N6-L-threonylcarbamoyladenine synthase
VQLKDPQATEEEQPEQKNAELQFPFLSLVVSGGHTQIWLAESLGKYTILGSTLDDAVGESFDKVARLLGITPREHEQPGAAVERLARSGDAMSDAIDLPIMLLKRHTADFSFSGLKSSVRRHVQLLLKVPRARLSDPLASLSSDAKLGLSAPVQADFCAAFQRAASLHLQHKTAQAIRYCQLKHLSVKQLVRVVVLLLLLSSKSCVFCLVAVCLPFHAFFLFCFGIGDGGRRGQQWRPAQRHA